MPGFRSYVQTGIVLQVNANPAVDVVLQPGQPSDQVQVQANVAMVETRNSGVGQVMENQLIVGLPSGRRITDLILLLGAVTPGSPGRSGIVKRLISHTLTATTEKRPKSVPIRLTHHQRRREGSKKTAESDIAECRG